MRKNAYNELSDIEKGWLREYKEWCKCAKENPIQQDIRLYAINQAEHYANYLRDRGLNISDYC